MKILRCIHSLDPHGGGVAETVRASSLALIQKAVECEVVSLDEPSDPWVANFPVPVHALGPGRGHYGYSGKFRRWLDRNLEAYDCCFIEGLWQYPGLAVSQSARKYDLPCFVFPHGMLDPWFNRYYPLKFLKKLIYWFFIERRNLKKARAVFFTAGEEWSQARRSFPFVRCSPAIAPLGIAGQPEFDEAPEEVFSRQYPELAEKSFLLFLGRIHEKKGLTELLTGYAEIVSSSTPEKLIPDLVVAGPFYSNTYKEHLHRIAGERGLADRVHWVGMLSGAVKWGAFKKAEAFILPSHQENFGIAVVEALSVGTPVLISDRINIWREIIEDGAGLAANDTAGGVTQLINNWLKLDESAKIRMAQCAINCFQNRFEIDRSVENLVAMVRSLI